MPAGRRSQARMREEGGGGGEGQIERKKPPAQLAPTPGSV
jgi:hypothetical protein